MPFTRLRAIVVGAALLLTGAPSPALSQVSPPGAPAPAVEAAGEEARRYRVFLITVDQGEEVWELFGHNAILIADSVSGESLAWNWGLFNFEDEGFLRRFLRGEMRYTMAPADSQMFIRSYAAGDRKVYANEIFLTQAEAGALDAFVRNNYLPENRPYIYHYFLDNCSTRVRDALDSVLGGLLREEFSERTTDQSFRWHSRRLVQVEGWVDQGLSFLLGMRGDEPITEWEAMFAPLELMRLIEGVERGGPDGTVTPLVGPRIEVTSSSRPAAPALPPSFSPLWLGLGLVLGGGIAGLGYAGGRGAWWGGVGVRLGAILWGLFSGLLGSLLLFALFTDHNFIRANLNIFLMSPLGLLVALAAGAGLLRQRWREGMPERLARGCAALILLLAAGAALLQASPFLAQGNAEVLALALPLNLGVAWGFRLLKGRQDSK